MATLQERPHDPGEDGQRIMAALRGSAPVDHIMGKAGTGKSNLIRWLAQQLRGDRNMAIVAPTGTAAIQVGGTTVHSLFRFPPRIVTQRDILQQRRSALIGCIDLLIVDECSMIRGDLMDAIELSLRHHTGNSLPFGGVKVLLVGDPFQLPPVLRQHEETVLAAAGYRGPQFFQANSVADVDLGFVELSTAYRHPDPHWVDLLDSIRTQRNPADALREVNRRTGKHPTSGPALTTLVTRNSRADEINAWHMDRLPGCPVSLVGEVSGSFGIDNRRLPVPRILNLKPGARVMLIRNDPGGRWHNGSVGVVQEIEEERVVVKLESGRTGATHEVERACWDEYRYEYNTAEARIVPVRVGRYVQYPLLSAWALTIHRSQGATLERVKIDMDTGAFAPGQVYVALSRARDLEQIELVRPIFDRDLIHDPAVTAFWRHMRQAHP